MEPLNPIFLIFLIIVCLAAFGWFLLHRFQNLLSEKKEDQSLLLVQQQIDQLRGQFTQVLDNSTQLIHQQLGQLLNNVNERLKEGSEVLQKTQQSLGERLDNAARVVGNVQKSLGSLEEANRKIYEVGKDIAFLPGGKAPGPRAVEFPERGEAPGPIRPKTAGGGRGQERAPGTVVRSQPIRHPAHRAGLAQG